VVCQDGKLKLSLFDGGGNLGSWMGMVDMQLLLSTNLRLEVRAVLAEIVE
jgi:hypothetical protein